ncbi:MAG: hypothetical protein Q9219_006362 [cf. Caloplaca sp. 3 TL-2023]
MFTDDITNQTYHTPLLPSTAAEETYDFIHYHTPSCDRATCDGKCGMDDLKALKKSIRARKQQLLPPPPQGEASNSGTTTTKDGNKKKRENHASDETAATTSSAGGGTSMEEWKIEEPGDSAFVLGGGGKGKGKGKRKGSAGAGAGGSRSGGSAAGTPTKGGKKKVKFAGAEEGK